MAENTLKVVIPPEVLATLEQNIPAEELQALLTEISDKAASGELFDDAHAVDLDELRLTDPEEYAALMAAIQAHDFSDDDGSFLDTRVLN